MKRALLAVALLAFGAMAQDRPGGGPRVEVRPGMGGGGGGAWGGGGMGSQFYTLIYTLSELNFTPDFTLTKEQKEKIQALREDFKKAQEKWRTDHQEDFKKAQEQWAEVRGADPANREKWQEISKAQQQLWATSPNGDEQAKAIKSVLTPEQLKLYEDKIAQRQAEAEKARKQWEERNKATPKPPEEDGKPKGL